MLKTEAPDPIRARVWGDEAMAQMQAHLRGINGEPDFEAAGQGGAGGLLGHVVRTMHQGCCPTSGTFTTDSPSIRDVILFPHLRPE